MRPKSTNSWAFILKFVNKEAREGTRFIDNEFAGTTLVAYKLEDKIHLIADSRVSNDSKRIREEKINWKYKVGITKKYEIVFERLVVLCAGQAKKSLKILHELNDWIEAEYHNAFMEIEVAEVVDYVNNYFNRLDKSKGYQFAIIIAGYDSPTKNFRLHQFVVNDEVIESTEIEKYTCLGSGGTYAESCMADRYQPELSREESRHLAYNSLFLASLRDKSTDGNLHLFEVNKTRCERIGNIQSLPLYMRYYHLYDEKCILFSIYDDKYDPIPADIFESYFSEPGTLDASHCVDHRWLNIEEEDRDF
ncbi:uncharacterized protein LOC141720066 [Apium graveolens]|uniref:uncharacterized protein LOC141720066 n=1 Tax=Apium graveolens TaxID=4045 RepID=UPI003D7A5E96